MTRREGETIFKKGCGGALESFCGDKTWDLDCMTTVHTSISTRSSITDGHMKMMFSNFEEKLQDAAGLGRRKKKRI